MNAQVRRVAASPYARRLARERALPLEALRGSGPGGRILAADIIGYVPVATPDGAAPAAAPSIAASRIAAFATSVALGALQDLLAALEGSGRVFDIDDVLLCAAGRAFAGIPDAAKPGDTSVALELAGRQAVFAMIPETSLTSLRATRLAALADSRDDAERPAPLSLRVLPASDVRPVMMPLLPGRAMRLTVSLDAPGIHAECLLTTDAGSIDEAIAATWLSALKSAIENPLRLFV
ncbi:E3 binding domain-containing protein [Mesorhizobium sp. dw_380]|uniref:E3 binding domain-containing protein n=1 Tax=Mesorhizobium sp. dw_380 TaxID=2812001 RepID=UPI001BDEF46A|nr:E3 binding domain-containing protein [Mesorhizobium sp. dw_380]